MFRSPQVPYDDRGHLYISWILLSPLQSIDQESNDQSRDDKEEERDWIYLRFLFGAYRSIKPDFIASNIVGCVNATYL